MTVEEAYQCANETGHKEFTFTRRGQSVKAEFMEPLDMGEVYLPQQKKRTVIQRFYDEWEAAATKQLASLEEA